MKKKIDIMELLARSTEQCHRDTQFILKNMATKDDYLTLMDKLITIRKKLKEQDERWEARLALPRWVP